MIRDQVVGMADPIVAETIGRLVKDTFRRVVPRLGQMIDGTGKCQTEGARASTLIQIGGE